MKITVAALFQCIIFDLSETRMMSVQWFPAQSEAIMSVNNIEVDK